MLFARHSRCRDAAPARRTFSTFAALGLCAPVRCLAVVGCLLACGPAAHAFRFQVEDAGGSTTSQRNPGTFTATLTIVSITESGDALVGIGWFGGSGMDALDLLEFHHGVDRPLGSASLAHPFDLHRGSLEPRIGIRLWS